MKKVVTLLLTVILAFSMAVTASAALGSPDINSAAAVSGDKSNTVDVTVTGVATASTIYYIIIDWDSLDFTYNYNEASSDWDPEKHQFDVTADSGTEGWNKTTAGIRITNHSNAQVTVSASFNGGAITNTVNGAKADLVGSGATLPSAVSKAVNAPELTTSYSVNVSGTPNKANISFTVDTVTITLS